MAWHRNCSWLCAVVEALIGCGRRSWRRRRSWSNLRGRQHTIQNTDTLIWGYQWGLGEAAGTAQRRLQERLWNTLGRLCSTFCQYKRLLAFFLQSPLLLWGPELIQYARACFMVDEHRQIDLLFPCFVINISTCKILPINALSYACYELHAAIQKHAKSILDFDFSLTMPSLTW